MTTTTVPTEPTEAMIEAGAASYNNDVSSNVARSIWAAMIAAAPVPAWLPIESAPKDGTEMIGLCGRKDVRLVWYFRPSSRTQGWCDQNAKRVHPTHWMPLHVATSEGVEP